QQNSKTAKQQNSKTAKQQNSKTAKQQNSKTAKQQNSKTAKQQNSKILHVLHRSEFHFDGLQTDHHLLHAFCLSQGHYRLG
ncbi:hypothetical protein, partial [Acinetobacter sp. YH12083]|uniref:hypothetical protein n=1 Tax=Acinetobacter sp. YH12083 TaxID=2601076 RepID=UPI0015D196C0